MTTSATQKRAQFEDVDLGVSNYFGASLTEEKREANYTSVTDVTLLALDREHFKKARARRVLPEHDAGNRR